MTARRSSSPPRGAGSGAPVTGDLRRREQLRQQLLASAVLARFDAPLSPVLAGWLQQDGATARRGVAAYRANAQAIHEEHHTRPRAFTGRCEQLGGALAVAGRNDDVDTGHGELLEQGQGTPIIVI